MKITASVDRLTFTPADDGVSIAIHVDDAPVASACISLSAWHDLPGVLQLEKPIAHEAKTTLEVVFTDEAPAPTV